MPEQLAMCKHPDRCGRHCFSISTVAHFTGIPFCLSESSCTAVCSPPLLGGPQEAAANAPTADEAAAASPAAATMQPEPPKERLPTIFLSVAAYR